MKSVLNDSDLKELEERLVRLTVGTPPQWGRMSAPGMVCHLTDSFQIVLGTRPTSRTSTRLERTVIRLIALSLPLRWPKGVATVAEVDQERGGTPPEDFAADVARLRTAMRDFVTRVPRESLSHPIFGRVSTSEWGRWGYRHVDHHLRQFGR
jgi:hypothetical protein